MQPSLAASRYRQENSTTL
jgi:hypothetical protein